MTKNKEKGQNMLFFKIKFDILRKIIKGGKD